LSQQLTASPVSHVSNLMLTNISQNSRSNLMGWSAMQHSGWQAKCLLHCIADVIDTTLQEDFTLANFAHYAVKTAVIVNNIAQNHRISDCKIEK